MQADVKYPKKGIFNRVHNIKDAIEKYEKDKKGEVINRKVEFQMNSKMTFVPEPPRAALKASGAISSFNSRGFDEVS